MAEHIIGIACRQLGSLNLEDLPHYLLNLSLKGAHKLRIELHMCISKDVLRIELHTCISRDECRCM